jgi:hypothetical protein
MRRGVKLFAVQFAGTLLTGCASKQPPPANPPAIAAPLDSLARVRQTSVDAVLREIAGRENELSTQVFKNIKALTFQVPAGQFVRAMDAFGRSLGVGCDHCHIVGQWDSDSLRPKRIARGMIRLIGMVNTELRNIQDFDRPVGASCWTCHQGSRRPSRGPFGGGR